MLTLWNVTQIFVILIYRQCAASILDSFCLSVCLFVTTMFHLFTGKTFLSKPLLSSCRSAHVYRSKWEKICDNRRWLCDRGKHTGTCDLVKNLSFSFSFIWVRLGLLTRLWTNKSVQYTFCRKFLQSSTFDMAKR